ncbi:hypothetical protein PIB30_047685 [Stylosanthes scabra]|uniref:Uncharacterized protein n=1 Tax=Stylosanthes scabra TaxID=79078 RepID=A0ABU6ZFK5_9FABA|nr:hypothetical protein [Stylosanthes scabra]
MRKLSGAGWKEEDGDHFSKNYQGRTNSGNLKPRVRGPVCNFNDSGFTLQLFILRLFLLSQSLAVPYTSHRRPPPSHHSRLQLLLSSRQLAPPERAVAAAVVPAPLSSLSDCARLLARLKVTLTAISRSALIWAFYLMN